MKSCQNKELLIIFTRYPEPGKTKTRLVQALGNEGAADLQRKLTEQTMSTARYLQQMRAPVIRVYYEGGDILKMQKWLGPDRSYQLQNSGSLGERLDVACSDAFRLGFKKVVIIGSDCPGLSPGHIAQAFEALQHQDLVLGPAADGGYYLIGLKQYDKSLFTGIPWGTDKVLEFTLKAGKKHGLSIETLEILSDVDRPEDLRHIDHNSDS